jgi:hypothetical protein
MTAPGGMVIDATGLIGGLRQCQLLRRNGACQLNGFERQTVIVVTDPARLVIDNGDQDAGVRD